MNNVKKLLSGILAVLLLVNLVMMPGFALEESTFSMAFKASSDFEGEDPVENVKTGDTFFVYLTFSGNTKENNVCALDLYIGYDTEALQVTQMMGVGPCNGASCNTNKNGHAFITWAYQSGLVEQAGFDSVVLTEGNLAVLKCVAKENLSSSVASKFYIVNDGTSESFVANQEKTKLNFSVNELVLPVLVPDSVLIYSENGDEVQVPTAGQETVTVAYQVIVIDAEGEVQEEPSIQWTVSGPSSNVTVNNGVVSVPSSAVAGQYTIKATYGQGDSAIYGEKTLQVKKEASEPQLMTLSYSPAELTVPGGEDVVTATPTVTVTDQYGGTMADPDVSYTLTGSYAGVSLDEKTGVLTVTNAAKDAFTTTGTKLTITATCGQATDTAIVSISKGESVATSITILNRFPDDSEEPVPVGDSIAIEKPLSYNVYSPLYLGAVVYDQYGQIIENASVTWSTAPEVPETIEDEGYQGVTANGASNNGYNLFVCSDAENGMEIEVTASYDNDKVTKSFTLTVTGLEIDWPQANIKDNPTYGETWAEIVTGFTGGSASLNGKEIDGEFTLRSIGGPTSTGVQYYDIQFMSDDGRYWATAQQSVNIASCPVTLTWSGYTDLVYDGSPKNVTATVNGVIDNDVCTVTVTNGNASEPGTHKAKAELTGDHAYKYQLEQDTCEYTIAKATVELPTAVTDLKYNGDAQTGVELPSDAKYTLSGNTATSAGSHTATATLTDPIRYQWPDGATEARTISWSIAPADYLVNLSNPNVSVKVGTNGTDFLPSAVGTGVKGEEVEGDLTFYTDDNCTMAVTKEWVSEQAMGDYTLYWSFTTDNSNYVSTAKCGSITMKVIEGDPQNISFAESSKTVTFGDAPFTNTVSVTTTDDVLVSNSTVTYTSSDPQVVTVNKNTGEVTIIGVGSATITATAAKVSGEYAEGTGIYTVTVAPKELNDGMVAAVANTSYTGNAIHPDPPVTDGTKNLVKGTDFIYSYGDNTDAGEATVTVTGKGNYRGTVTKTFTITKADYEGTAAKIVSIVKNRDEEQTGTLTAADFLTEKLEGAIITGVTGNSPNVLSSVPTVHEDGTLSYTAKAGLEGDIDDDAYTVTIATTNYNNITATLTFHATDKQNVSEQITFENGSAVYNGQVQTYEKATFTGTGSGSITYTYSPADVKDARTYTVTATYEDDTQVGTAQATFVIEKKPLTVTAGTATITKVYDGKIDAGTLNGALNVTGLCAADTATELETGTVPSYSKADVHTENLDVPVSLPESLAKNYTLAQTSVSIPASITAKEITPVVEDVAAVTYNGTAQQPKPAVKDGETALVEGRDFTYSYANNTNAGTATVTVAAKNGGNYTFTSVSKDFAIEKAEYPGTVPSQTVNISQNRNTAQTGTLTLGQLMSNAPAGAAIESVTPGSGTMMQEVKVDGGKISYTSKTNITTNTDEVYQVTVSSTNYEDFQIELTFHPVAKTAVTVSGVSVADKTYNGKAASYTGTPVAKVGGQTVSVTGYTYTWYDAAGDALTGAPKNAGTYSLVIAVKDTDPNYSGAQTVRFEIKKATVTITPKDVQVKQGDDMPELKYTVSGLAGGDALAKTPKLTCNADLDKVGKYEIKASDAQVPDTDNYKATIIYETGMLEVTDKDAGETSTVERPDGSVVTTVEREDGTSQVTYERPDGAYSVTEIDKDDCSATQVYLPTEVIEDADGDVITLPMYAVTAAARWSDAPTVTVDLPRNTSVRVEIPVTRVQPGTVAVLVKSNGAQEVIQNTVTTKDGIYVKLSDGDTVKIVNNASSFDDVSGSYWGADAIDYATSRELFDGVGNDKFDPEGQMTRAMIVTVLARYVGVDTSTGDEWYDAGRSWAMRNNASDGTNMNGSVTREQLVTMLWRYVGEPKGSRITGFVDTDEISSYAEEAIGWAVDLGLIEGMGHNNIDPQGTATRAQVSAILMRFIQATN